MSCDVFPGVTLPEMALRWNFSHVPRQFKHALYDHALVPHTMIKHAAYQKKRTVGPKNKRLPDANPE